MPLCIAVVVVCGVNEASKANGRKWMAAVNQFQLHTPKAIRLDMDREVFFSLRKEKSQSYYSENK